MEKITSMHNPRVQAWRSLKTKSGREAEGAFLVEGFKSVGEALSSSFELLALIVEDGTSLPDSAPEGRTFVVPAHLMAAVCDTKTPQGIAAVMRLQPRTVTGKRLLALDGVQDPGNVGTILRTADAAGLDGILYSKDLTMLVAYPFAATATTFDIPTTVTALHDYCLSGNNNLVAVNIPETVTWMGMNIFRDCQNIVEIDVPDGVTHMGITVFGGCTSLTRVHLPANLDTIKSSTFSGCTLLTEVTVPRNVSCIDEQGFINARSLKTVTFEEGSRLASLGERAFLDCYALESLDLPSTVSSIGSGCFSSCRSLKTIHMPHNLTEIGSSIFTGCNSLTECEVIGDVPTMWNIFINCPKLKKVKLGDRNGTPGSTLIQNATITRCNQLEYLELGANIDSLENSALCSLDSLKVLICWATTPPRCHNYWSSFSLWPNELKNTVLYVPKASLEAYQTANDWKNFKTIVPIDDVGDVNGDGKLSIRDVNELINLLLSGENTDIATTFADVNLDGKISISDVTTLINRLLSGD